MSISSVDISDFFGLFVTLFRNIFIFCYDFMRSIEFFGTNLLSFTITVFLLGAILPVLFSLVQSRSVRIANAANNSLNKIKSRRSRSGSSTELTTRD